MAEAAPSESGISGPLMPPAIAQTAAHIDSSSPQPERPAYNNAGATEVDAAAQDALKQAFRPG